MSRIIIVFVLLISHWNSLICGERLFDSYAKEIKRSFAEEMQRELGLIWIGEGGSMPDDIESFSLMFDAFQRATINEACALEVHVTEKLLERINSDINIRPYLREYPFTVPRAQISISFYQPDGRPYTDGIVVGHVHQTRGYVFYRKVNAEGDLSDLGEEPYEAALKIAQNPHLHLKHDFSRRWGKIKKETLLLHPEEEERFLNAFYVHPPIKRWERLKEIAENNSPLSLSEAIRELITGVTEPYFGESLIESIAEMERKQKDGEYVDYWNNGQIRFKGSFKNGLADGHIHGWYENGYDAFKGYFYKGKKQGVHIAFFPPKRAGGPLVNKARVLSYTRNGKAHGQLITKYPKGGLESLMTYKNGVLEGEMEVYANNREGLLEERTYKRGKLIDQKIYPPKRKPVKYKNARQS